MSTRWLLRGIRAVIALAIVLLPASAWLGAAPAAAAPKSNTKFSFTDSRIDACSGLAVSPQWKGIAFTINDHMPTRVFAVNKSDGSTAATMRLSNADMVDWEAIGADGSGKLWVGDIGDNEKTRSHVTVYEFDPPDPLDTGFYDATPHELTYPDGAHNAEAMLVDPDDGTIYIATKDSDKGGLYKADPASGDSELKRVVDVPSGVTDGAFSPDGKEFVLRGHESAYLYSSPGKQKASFALPKQKQGEAVAYAPSGKALLLGGEGASDVLRLKLKDVTGGAHEPTRHASDTHPPVRVSSDGDDGGSLINWLFVIGPFLIAAVAGVVAVLWRRRSTPVPAATGATSGRRKHASAHARRGDDDWPDRDDRWPLPGRSARNDDWPVPERPAEHAGHAHEPGAGSGPGRVRRRRGRHHGDDSLPFWLRD
ncbi:MAG: YncE family protein [Streptosporangiales bacterium]